MAFYQIIHKDEGVYDNLGDAEEELGQYEPHWRVVQVVELAGCDGERINPVIRPERHEDRPTVVYTEGDRVAVKLSGDRQWYMGSVVNAKKMWVAMDCGGIADENNILDVQRVEPGESADPQPAPTARSNAVAEAGVALQKAVDAALATDDDVERPAHYRQGSVECIDAIRAQLTPEEFRGYCKGNVAKYVWRERMKEGDKAIKKARWYLNQMLRG